ncbi:MAG: hypothetical protein QOC78_484 [Solirubrobacteraceae bacterium]|jgi:hypothetical protein|nr:hypothetical protein [Solirubrobacteraceae bacterium]
MSPAPTIRTQACSADQGRKRLQDARKFLEVADLVDDEPAVISAGDVANAFQRLLRIKDDAQYGLRTISAPKRRAALRHAGKMVDFAEHVLADAA